MSGWWQVEGEWELCGVYLRLYTTPPLLNVLRLVWGSAAPSASAWWCGERGAPPFQAAAPQVVGVGAGGGLTEGDVAAPLSSTECGQSSSSRAAAVQAGPFVCGACAPPFAARPVHPPRTAAAGQGRPAAGGTPPQHKERLERRRCGGD